MATTAPAPVKRRTPWPVELYRSAVGKKYVMAITGVIGLGYVIAHLIGNTKIYFGAESINFYGEWLRESLGYPVLPHTWTLWLMRLTLIAALILHVHASYALTVMNRRARPQRYVSRPDYVAADFASRTMRWTGVIVLLFIAFHLADLTWGVEAANPDFVRGDVFNNVQSSFSRGPVVAFYVIAQVALAVHIYHGVWSLFQSLGLNNRRFNHWRRSLAIATAVVVGIGNISFPVLAFFEVVTPEGIL